MNEKTIKGALTRKISGWIASIESESVRKLCEENTIVTGGSIVSMLTCEKVNDYDIYFRDIETTYAVATYYFNKIDCEKNGKDCVIKLEDRVKTFISSSGFLKANKSKVNISEDGEESIEEQENEKPKYLPAFITSNAISLTDKIQIITRFFGSPDEIHKNFDFIHCQCYYDFREKDLVLPQKSLLSILTKRLRYYGSKYPVCSVFRLRKFLKRGWNINAGEIFKICFQISEINLHDVTVLEDQLIGVDTQYFVWFISKLKEMQAEGEEKVKDFVIDYDHVKEMIDGLFN